MSECKLDVKQPPEVIGPLPDGIRANFYFTGGSVDGPRLKGKLVTGKSVTRSGVNP